MWKMIVRVILIALLAWGFVWLADRPGTVSIEWLGYAVELPVMASILGLAAAVILLMVLFSIIIQGLTVGRLATRLGREPDLV